METSSRAVEGGGDWCSAGSGVKLGVIIVHHCLIFRHCIIISITYIIIQPFFFVNFYYGVQQHRHGVYHWALNNTTENDYRKNDVTCKDGLLSEKLLVTKGLSICNIDPLNSFRNSRLHNEMLCPSPLHHSNHIHGVLGREQHTFHSHCSGRRPRSHRSKWMERVVREVVEQEEETRIHPGWGWRRWASPPSPKT